MDMITFLNKITQSDDQYVVALLVTIIIASTVDWLFGWVNARFNNNINFESGVALYGIIKKMMYFITLVFFMVVAFLIVPEAVAATAVYTLYIGYLLSEANSIMSHLGVADDGKKGELLHDFVERLTNSKKD